MRFLISCFMALTLMSMTACGQDKQKITMTQNCDTPDSIKKQITMAYERMYRLMIAKDTKSLGAMLSDDFELVHMTGMHQPKTVYLKAIADGILNYFTAETEDILFDSISNDKVVITGQSRVNAAVFGGGKHTWPLQLRISLEQKDGQWIMTKAVASTY